MGTFAVLAFALVGSGGPGQAASAQAAGVARCKSVRAPVSRTAKASRAKKAHAPRKAAPKKSRSTKGKQAVASCPKPAKRTASKPAPTHAVAVAFTGATVAPSTILTSAPPTTLPAAAPPAATVTPTPSPATPTQPVSSAGDQILPLPSVNPFSPTSFWNAPLAATAPLDPNSGALVQELVRQVNAYGTWMDTASYSVPVYVVGPGQPTQHVTLNVWAPDLQAEFNAVPIPSTAQAAAGTDEHMTVWQPSTDKMWEFWKMQKESDGWHAQWGGEMDHVSTNPGYFTHSGQTNNWGATATGLPLLGGLVTQADLQRGYINHALAMAIVQTTAKCWSWPAQRTDGAGSTGTTSIPEGTRFRLNPAINIASLNLPPITRMLAQAAQTYAIVVRDKGGDVALFGQDQKSMATNPWPAEFPNTYPSVLLARFPWADLQVLQTNTTCSS